MKRKRVDEGDEVSRTEVSRTQPPKKKRKLESAPALPQAILSLATISSANLQKIITACITNKPNLVAQYLTNGVNVNQLLSYQINGTDNKATTVTYSLVHIAAANGATEVVRYLLVNRGAHTETLDYLGRTPLHIAAQTGQVVVALMLLKRGANINAKTTNGKTPVDFIPWSGQAKEQALRCTLLVIRNFSVEQRNQFNQEPLYSPQYRAPQYGQHGQQGPPERPGVITLPL